MSAASIVAGQIPTAIAIAESQGHADPITISLPAIHKFIGVIGCIIGVLMLFFWIREYKSAIESHQDTREIFAFGMCGFSVMGIIVGVITVIL